MFWKESEKDMIGSGFLQTKEPNVNQEPHMVSAAADLDVENFMKHVLGLWTGHNYIIVKVCRLARVCRARSWERVASLIPFVPFHQYKQMI